MIDPTTAQGTAPATVRQRLQRTRGGTGKGSAFACFLFFEQRKGFDPAENCKIPHNSLPPDSGSLFQLNFCAMPNLIYISPSFIVADLKTSVSFYVDQLGFEVRYMGPDGSRGVTFHQPLRDDEDGLRGFEVADADGYMSFFGRPN